MILIQLPFFSYTLKYYYKFVNFYKAKIYQSKFNLKHLFLKKKIIDNKHKYNHTITKKPMIFIYFSI